MSDPFNTDFIPPLRKPRVHKPKVPHETTYDLRKLYYEARRIMFERQYPAAWAEGEYYDNKFPAIETTNGTQNYIQDVLNNFGHQCERVNTGGFMRKGKWCTSGSTKGSSDLHCIVNGKAWKIEIKKDQDVLSKAQIKYQSSIIAAGGLHSTIYVGDLDWFWDEYYRIVKL